MIGGIDHGYQRQQQEDAHRPGYLREQVRQRQPEPDGERYRGHHELHGSPQGRPEIRGRQHVAELGEPGPRGGLAADQLIEAVLLERHDDEPDQRHHQDQEQHQDQWSNHRIRRQRAPSPSGRRRLERQLPLIDRWGSAHLWSFLPSYRRLTRRVRTEPPVNRILSTVQQVGDFLAGILRGVVDRLGAGQDLVEHVLQALPSSTLVQFFELGTNRPVEAAFTTTAAVASPALGLNAVELAM